MGKEGKREGGGREEVGGWVGGREGGGGGMGRREDQEK